MKNVQINFRLIFSLCVLSVAVFGTLAFKGSTQLYYSGFLEANDTIAYGVVERSLDSLYGSSRSHSYDGKRHELNYKYGAFELANLHLPNVESQNCIAAYCVTGEMSFNNDTVLIHAASQYKYLYVSTLDSLNPFDVYQGECTIKVVSKDLNGDFGEIYLSGIGDLTDSWRLFSLPKSVSEEQLWKAKHPRKTIAKFDLIQIENKGVTKTYNRSDILLIGANSLTYKANSKK